MRVQGFEFSKDFFRLFISCVFIGFLKCFLVILRVFEVLLFSFVKGICFYLGFSFGLFAGFVLGFWVFFL